MTVVVSWVRPAAGSAIRTGSAISTALAQRLLKMRDAAFELFEPLQHGVRGWTGEHRRGSRRNRFRSLSRDHFAAIAKQVAPAMVALARPARLLRY